MPRLHFRLSLRLFGALVAALILAWGAKVTLDVLRPRGLSLPPQLAGLLTSRDSVARVLAEPPAAGETFELDAFLDTLSRRVLDREAAKAADEPLGRPDDIEFGRFRGTET